ncbi:MAG: UvrD-helicase domain-containing protein [Thermoleophilia bacterium]
MSEDSQPTSEIVDELLGYWSSSWNVLEGYYLKHLLPQIVAGREFKDPRIERPILRLRERLTGGEWLKLPHYVAERRAGRSLTVEWDRKLAERTTQRRALVERLRPAFEREFLSADEVWRTHPASAHLPESEYDELKAQFVQEWEDRALSPEHGLDCQQAAAVGAVGGDIEVVARAGSGKTRTLVTRAIFLQKHCRVPPGALLLLAFNRKAADEIKGRLGKALEGDLPHVMTFHALAYALVLPEEELVYDEDAHQQQQSRLIQEVIDDHLQSDTYLPIVRKIMMGRFLDDWETIEKGGFHLPIPELVKHRSALPRETLRGEYVKSFGEKIIANTLFSNGVSYKYERNFRWSGVNYRPDFTILLGGGRGVVIEYFGLKGDSDYDEMSSQKRDFWATQDDWRLIEFAPADITSRGEEAFKHHLLEVLRAAGVEHQPLSDEEMWQLIERRAIDGFTGAMRSFVGRCRKRNLSTDELQALIGAHATLSEAEELFLTVGVSVYAGYLHRLATNNQEDFDGLMWRAIELLERGHGRFARDRGRETGDVKDLQFVMLDEFQDFSEMFFRLTKGIRGISPTVEFFCVGDNWQAINGFAGSELRFFEHFEQYFSHTRRMLIDTNYRSPVRIVEAGNAAMKGLGDPARPHRADSGNISAGRLDAFTPTVSERARHGVDELTPAVLRLVKHALDQGRNTVMLSRRKTVSGYVKYSEEPYRRLDGLPRFEEHIRSFFPKEDRKRITVSTAHKYKGAEEETVIILDANQGCYPLIHTNWVFLRVFGDSLEDIEAEERRLFYVALTRAKDTLYVLSEGARSESPYLGDVWAGMRLPPIDWGQLGAVPSLDGARLEVRVTFPYDEERNEQLRKLAYRFDFDAKYWHRSYMAQEFDLDALCVQSWAQAGVEIEVHSESGELLEARRVEAGVGRW